MITFLANIRALYVQNPKIAGVIQAISGKSFPVNAVLATWAHCILRNEHPSTRLRQDSCDVSVCNGLEEDAWRRGWHGRRWNAS